MASETAICPQCAGALPEQARFCPHCGNRLEAEGDTRPVELPPPESGRVPINIVSVEPRFFGLTPPLFSFGLGGAGLALGAVFLALERWISGIVLLVLAFGFFALGLGVARRRPNSAVARVAARLANGVSAQAHLLGGSVGAWSGAGRQLVRARRVLRALRAERERVQLMLGAAAYWEDEPETAWLRERMRAIYDQIEAWERSAREAMEQARRRVARERFSAKATERIIVEDGPEAAAGPGPDRND